MVRADLRRQRVHAVHGLHLLQLAQESKAGRFGTFVLLLVLGFGLMGFAAKGLIKYFIAGVE